MAPLSLKIVLDNGAVTRTVLFDTTTTVEEAHDIVFEKFHSLGHDKEYALFLTSVDNDKSGIWLESHRTLEFYMLRDGDSLQYLCKIRNMRVRMLDGSVKTLQVDESKVVGDLLLHICNKLGITNHDEYGLCHDEQEEVEESKSAVGTLTLKKNKAPREKDARLEQLSKKLKTDDNVEWLDHKKTLRELCVDPKETLLLKRRLFYSDRKIDARDPVQLNLLYVQTRDNILSGRQVTTEEKAIEFAGIQYQIHFGDFDEEKHKPGFIENLAEYLPAQYASSWGIEKKIYREYKKHAGVSQLDAKYLYTKVARELPTYGVTFFLVKEKQKNKKKLIPRLLGINANSILRLDENTKEILKVWLLTQVKSYHAGKETFTLNFGDYSDKEYVVKTNEAYRIRDILEGYIDIIRKKLEGPSNFTPMEGQMICEDNVELARANIVQTVGPQKLVEHNFMGPSQIISYEPGQKASHGTQFVTLQQMKVTNTGSTKQQAVRGEVSQSHIIPAGFEKKITHLNSESVKVVMLLSDPSPNNIQQIRTIADDFLFAQPDIIQGVQELAKQQTTEEDRKRLLDELDELCNHLNSFGAAAKRSDLESPENLQKVEDDAKKIAELSTQIIFSLDPRSRKRSEMLRRSRKSFIADERVEATLRRASFLTISSTACKSVENAIEDMEQPYEGPQIKEDDLEKLEAAAVDKMGKLNAAVALLLEARADPKNVDYETAVNSMKTISELTPLLIQDAKAIGSTKDGENKRHLLDQIRALCESLDVLCKLTGVDDGSEMQEAASNYAKTSGKLIYVFNPRYRGGKNGSASVPDKEKEIMNLAKEAGGKASLMLSKANELINSAFNDPRTQGLDDARVKCSDAAQGLLACSQLVAPTIREPHCQSALTAAAENLSSSATRVCQAWRPLTEEKKYHHYGKELDDRHADLTKALQRLQKAYGDLNDDPANSVDEEAEKVKEMKRLEFITRLAAAKSGMAEAERELQDACVDLKGKQLKDLDGTKEKLKGDLSQKLAQLNAALASLIRSTSDVENPDYETAASAIDIINELTPDIIRDTQSLCPYENEKTRKLMLEEVGALCKAARAVCLSAENGDHMNMHEVGSDFANSSGTLCYIFNPRNNPDKENKILDISRSACKEASEMLSKVYQLTEAVGGDNGSKLDAAGTKVVEAAQTLLIVAQMTAPSIKDARCQSTLLASADKVSELTMDLADLWEPIVSKPEYLAAGNKLNRDRAKLEATLEKLRNACKPDDTERVDTTEDETKAREKHRLKFIMTTAEAKKKLDGAGRHLKDVKDIVAEKANKNTTEHKELQRRSAQKLAELNAAIAALVRATSDTENPDYKTAEASVASISKLTPEIVKITNELCPYTDEKHWRPMLDNVRALLRANKIICDSMDNGDFKELNDAADKFAYSSGKLYYVFNPRANAKKENQILEISKEVCEKTSEMLAHVYELAENVGGEEGSRLDTSGSRTVDAAQTLLTTAQITAPSISDSNCQSALVASADTVQNLSQELSALWEPLVKDSTHQRLGDQLRKGKEVLEAVLEKLRNACKMDADVETKKLDDYGAVHDKQHIKFLMMASAAKKKLDETENLLQDSNIALEQGAPEKLHLERSLSEKLAELNAAIAGLMRATADPKNINHEAGERSITAINRLTPEIIQNVKKLTEYSEVGHPRRGRMLDKARALLRANRVICDCVEKNNVRELNNAASTFAERSGALLSQVHNPREHCVLENQILELSEEACRKTSEMLSEVNKLAEKVGAEDSSKLDSHGSRVAEAAQALLTTAQITAPTITAKGCQSALISAADEVSERSQKLSSLWKPIVQSPKHQALGKQLSREEKKLETTLQKLRNLRLERVDTAEKAKDPKPHATEDYRRKVTVSASHTKNKMEDIEKLLQDNAAIKKGNSKLNKDTPEYNDLKRRLAEKLAELNSAIAAIVYATSDTENPDYESAVKSFETISNLTPAIIQNTNKLCEYEDKKEQQVLLDNVKALANANKLICASVEKDDIKALNSAAKKFAKSSSELSYVCKPPADVTKQNQIIDLSNEIGQKTSEMLTCVYRLAEDVGGEVGSDLDTSGARVVDAAKALLTVAKISVPSLDEGRCKSTLISSAKNLSSLNEDLCGEWTPVVRDHKHRASGEELRREKKELDALIQNLIAECNSIETRPRPQKPEVPKRKSVVAVDDKLKATKHVHFCQSMDVAQDSIKKAQEDLKTTYNQKPTRPLIIAEQEKLQELMQKNLALAGVTVSQLITDMSPHHQNYESAVKSTKVLAELVPIIVKAGKDIGNSKEDAARKAFLDDILSLCEASNKLCDTSKNDVKNLNEVAVDFGNKASKLLYNVSAELDPLQEKEVIGRAREIGDSASRLAVRGAGGAGGAGGEGRAGGAGGAARVKGARAHALCAAGARCADAAGDLMYTAKLVAPSIHNPASRKALLDVSNELSSKTNEFYITWLPLSENPEHVAFVKELDAEREVLMSLLERFNQDLKNDKMVRRKVVEKLEVQDTPLRQLASNILETAKAKAESTNITPEDRKSFSNYANKLAAAIEDMDIANAKCRNLPHDIRRRENLEEAVQHLQQTCLESRIQSGDEKRFVDLMDLINDVSSNANTLSEKTKTVKPEYNKSALIRIVDEADDIVKEASEASQAPAMREDGGDVDDILIIKRFAQKCDERADAIKKTIAEVRDAPSRSMLQDQLTCLKGSNDLLRFAVNSHLSAVRSAALDMNQADFEGLEKNIDNVLQSTRKTKKLPGETFQDSASATMATATTLCSAVASPGAAAKIPSALAAYLLEARSNTDFSDPKQKYRLEEHLKKLLHLLKTQNLASSRRIVTWQDEDDGEIAEITHLIIKEIETYNKEDCDGVQKRSDVEVVNESDLKKLLLPSKNIAVQASPNELQQKFEQQLQKVSSMPDMVQAAIGKRESLARTLHTVADAASELVARARSVGSDDPIKKMRVVNASQAMCSATYNLLKTADAASKDPRNPDSRRRLHEACRLLNESINKLSRITLPQDRLKRDCSDICRNLNLQIGLLQTDYPPSCMTYAACLEPLENQNYLQSVQSKDSMTREEFSANLQYLSSMVCNSAEYAAQCGYLLTLPEEYKHIAKEGFLNVPRIRNITGDIRVDCLKIIRCDDTEQANYTLSEINKHVAELQEVVQETMEKMKDPHMKKAVSDGWQEVDSATKDLREALKKKPDDRKAIVPMATKLLDAAEEFNAVTNRLSVIPKVTPCAECKARADEVIGFAKTLIMKTQALVKQVGSSDEEFLSWKMFETGRNGLVKTYEDFVQSIKENGGRAGFIQVEVEEKEKKEEVPKKTYVQIQLDLANKWLSKPATTPEVKSAGIQGVENILKLAETVSEDMRGEEKADMVGMVTETRELLDSCSVKYNSEKASVLLERLKELQKMLTWRVTTRVVEDFLEDEPLADLDVIADVEKDETKRKYILDKKIAELLAQLGKVTRTVRFVADTSPAAPGPELMKTRDQVELLAPALVKAAQSRVEHPDNTEVVENYKTLLAQYAESMAKLREICDRSVDPMDFAQAAGETMTRIREDSAVTKDPQTCAYKSRALTRLGLRVIDAGMSSKEVQSDPELKRALAQAHTRLAATAARRASKLPSWNDVTAEILRTTTQVESFLGGENIFQKQPEPDQPIYAAALGLHAAVREWSARDNEVVAVAKRMAVLMARLAGYMNTDRKTDLLTTSKDIVASSHQVAALARKLALECTDMRIRNNLMQVCERIPTISGQLKMLITVKGSSMGHQGTEEDREAMNTLIGNAQNLMMSVQEVVKAAIGASVKIMSQRGRMKWVRRVYY